MVGAVVAGCSAPLASCTNALHQHTSGALPWTPSAVICPQAPHLLIVAPRHGLVFLQQTLRQLGLLLHAPLHA